MAGWLYGTWLSVYLWQCISDRAQACDEKLGLAAVCFQGAETMASSRLTDELVRATGHAAEV